MRKEVDILVRDHQFAAQYVEEIGVGKISQPFKTAIWKVIQSKPVSPFWEKAKLKFGDKEYRRDYWNTYTNAERVLQLQVLLGEKVIFHNCFEFLIGKDKNWKVTEKEWGAFIEKINKFPKLPQLKIIFANC